MPFVQGIHYSFHRPKEVDPSRPPLILIHGAGGSFLSWHPHLRRLKDETVYALDLPGHGRSQGRGRQSIEEYADDVLQFMQSVGIQKAVLAGHSMGSAVVLMLALRHPEKLAGLALLGGGAKLRVSPVILEKVSSQDTFAAAVQMINEYSFNPDASPDLLRLSIETMSKVSQQTLFGDLLACNSFDVIERLAEIQTPTLLLCGTLDVMAPPKFSKFLHEQLPNAQLHLLEGTGHMLALEQPDTIVKLLKFFLDEVSPRP